MNLLKVTAPTSSMQSSGLQGRELVLAMAVIVCGIVLCVLDSTMLNLALPQMARQFQIDAAQALWVVNANQIASLVLLLPLAALGDRYGHKHVYLWGMLVFGLASILAALANSLYWLIVARALQGIGMAGVLSVNAALVRLIYPYSKLGRGMALNSMMVALSMVTGPVLAALVLSYVSWRWLFSLHLPLALWIFWLGMRSLPEPKNTPYVDSLPWWDAALNVCMFTALFLMLDRISHLQVAQSGYWALLAVVTGAVYVHRQKKQSQPMLPLDLLRIPVFRLSMFASICAFSAQSMAFLALPFLLIEARGLSTGEAGVLICAWPIALAVTAPFVGRQIGRISAGRLGAIGMLLFAAGLWALAMLPANAESWDIVWRVALCGAGFGMFQSPNNHTIVTAAPLARSGAASGMLGTARHVGQGLGAICLAGTFVLWSASVAGVSEQKAFWIAGGLAVLAGLFSGLRHLPVAKS